MSRISVATFALVLFGALASGAMAEEGSPPAKIYEGSVGAAPIVLKLEGAKDDPYGNYFYRSKRFDIDLSGEKQRGGVTLESHITGDKFSLKPTETGYDGSLTTSKGKTFPVELREVAAAPGNLPSDLSGAFDLYDKMRLAGLALKPDKTETISGKAIRWYVEPVSGVRVFRIESGYGAPILETLNKSLAEIQWRNVADYFGCPGFEGGAGLENSEVKSVYLSDAHVSFAILESWSCAGAAHPDFGIEEHSFDAKTGTEIEVDDLLKLSKEPFPTKDTDAWYEYRSKTFGPAIVALMKRLHPKEMKKPGKEDDCNYDDAEVWNFPTWYLTEQGVYVGAIFARAMRVCDDPEWSVIPWAEVKK